MQVLCPTQFGGGFTEPSAHLIDTGINPYKINSGEAHMIAMRIHSPVNVKRIQIGVVIRVIVGISPGIAVKYVV